MSMRTNSLFQWGLIVLLLSVLITTPLKVAQLQELINKAYLERTNDEIRDRTNQLFTHLIDAETGQRGFIVTGQAEYLLPFEQASRAIDHELAQLRPLLQNDRNRLQRFDELQDLIRIRMEIIERSLKLRREEGFEAAQRVILEGTGKQTMDQIRSSIDQLLRSAINSSRVFQTQWIEQARYVQTLTLVSGVLRAGLILGLIWILRRGLSLPTREGPLPTIRRFNRTYTVALGSIAVVLLVSQVFVQYRLTGLVEDANLLDLAGRQRMLSQELVKAALVAQSDRPAEQRQASFAEIERVLTL